MHLVNALLLTTSITLPMVLVTPVLAQDAPPPLGFVNKLGIDVDVRSSGRILQDEMPLGSIILPDSASAVGGG